MKSEPAYARSLETAELPTTDKERYHAAKSAGINYRQVIGELIYAMVTCRPDISFPLIKLSQYSANPAPIHYEAAKEILRYLACTSSDGIIYWRNKPRTDLSPPSETFDTETAEAEALTQDESDRLKSAADADWGGDVSHRRSVTGFALKLAGGAVYYKSRYQDTIALSSTEAEFAAATDAGKAILYVRTIMEELGLPQKDATILHIDNNGALNMANQQQPTKRTRHIDIKQFVIQEWVERDLLYLRRVSTADNYADAFTKTLGRILHYRHFDYIMGRIRPTFADNTGLPIQNSRLL